MSEAVEHVLEGRQHDLGGGLMVQRSLPMAICRNIGPFVFFDHGGPAVITDANRHALDVKPHPHIGLSTVSYLLSGAIRHRDNLGSDQIIVPGDVNWMTAGQGIVHSERFDTPEALQNPMELLQFWVALPEEHEETAPAFSHHGAAQLLEQDAGGVWLRLIAGSAWDMQSPVPTHSPLFYAHARLQAGARLKLPMEHEQRGIYVSRGAIEVDGGRYHERQLLSIKPGVVVALKAETDSTVMLLGGAPLGPRFMSWNFVSSRKERIREAAADWLAGRMSLPQQDQQEFVPLPAKLARDVGPAQDT